MLEFVKSHNQKSIFIAIVVLDGLLIAPGNERADPMGKVEKWYQISLKSVVI